MIVLILQIVLLMLQRRVMGRRPTAHETGYARRHSRRDTWAISRTEGRITEAQFDAAMRPYDRQVRTWNSKWMILYYWITYICILTYDILLEQAQAAAAPVDAPAPDDPPATADVPATAPIGHEHHSSEYTDVSSSDHGGSRGSSSSSD